MPLKIDFDNLITDADWVEAFAEILVFAASQTKATDDDEEDLHDLLIEFRNELPARVTLDLLREIAGEMSVVVAINIINNSINEINKNNKELNDLAKKLGVEVKKLNNSATLLKSIKEQVDKATKVVKTAKDIEAAATNPDLSKIKKLEAIIKSLEGLSGIFT